MSNLAILPVGNARPALPCRHFPMPYQAVIWRNWGMVPMARLAQILDCSEEQLVHAAGCSEDENGRNSGDDSPRSQAQARATAQIRCCGAACG